MSNLDPAPEAIVLAPGIHRAVDVLEARTTVAGDGTEVRRLLPQRTLRTVGAWCFLDHYGPDDVSIGPGMRVPPHPHIGLQTVSWLFEGLVPQASEDWAAGRFGEVRGYSGPPLAAPPLPAVPLKPR